MRRFLRLRRSAPGHTPTGRFTACVAIASLLGAVLLGLPTVAAHATDQVAPATPELLGGDIAPESDGLAVEITEVTPTIITTEDTLTVSGTVTNTSQEFAADPTISALTPATPTTDLADVTSYLTREVRPGYLAWQTDLGMGLEPGQTSTFTLKIPVQYLGLNDEDEWGARGLEVAAESTTAAGADRTIMLWQPSDSLPSARVTVLAPWTWATPGQDAAARTATATQLRGAVLNLARTPGVTLAIDPTVIPEAMRGSAGTDSSGDGTNATDTSTGDADQAASGATAQSGGETNASQSGRAAEAATAAERHWWKNFLSATSQVVALPPYDADLGLMSRANSSSLYWLARGSTQELEVHLQDVGQNLAQSPTSGTGTASAAAGTGTAGTGEATTPPGQPASDGQQSAQSAGSQTQASEPAGAAASAIEIPSVTADVVWPNTPVSTSLLAQMYDGVLILPPGQLRPESDPLAGARAQVRPESGEVATTGETEGLVTAMTSRADIVDLLTWSPASAEDKLDQRQVLAAVTAFFAQKESDADRTLLLPLPRATVIDQGLVDRVTALTSPTWATPVPLAELASVGPTLQERSGLNDPGVGETDQADMALLGQAYEGALPLFNALEDPSAGTSSFREPALAALASGKAQDERSRQVRDLASELADVQSAVRVESSVTVNLINKQGRVPVLVSNALEWPIRLDVSLQPSDPRLRVTQSAQLVVPPQATATAEVPVEAIGSGDIGVTYVVRTPKGEILDDTTTVTIRLRAEWEDAFTAVVAVLVAVLFVAGIIRTVKRRTTANPPADSEKGDLNG